LAEIRNPNIQGQGSGGGNAGGGGGDMRSMMAFMLLLVAVLFGYQYFFKPKPATETPSQTQSQNQSRNQTQTQAQSQQAASGQPQAATATAASGIPAVAAAMETDTTVENEQYKIVFTNRGAQVKHWILKKYNDTGGKPLDMVQQQASAQFGFPLALFTYEPALTTQLNQGLYQLTATGAQPPQQAWCLPPQPSAFITRLTALTSSRPSASTPATWSASRRTSCATVRRSALWLSGPPALAIWKSSCPPR